MQLDVHILCMHTVRLHTYVHTYRRTFVLTYSNTYIHCISVQFGSQAGGSAVVVGSRTGDHFGSLVLPEAN